MVTNAQVVAEFRPTLHQPGAFDCPRCHHDRSAPVGGKVRMIRCTRCHHQVSVTWGTIFAHAKLPFWVLRDLLVRWFLREPIPKVREVAARYGVAISTACSLIHRVLLRLAKRSRWRDPVFATVRALVTARRPSRRSVPLSGHAPVEVRQVMAACLASRRARAHTLFHLGVADRHVGIHEVWGYGRPYTGGFTKLAQVAVSEWLQHELRWRRVSLRWQACWVNGLLAQFGMTDLGGGPATRWTDVIALEHVAYRTIDPWEGHLDDAPWRAEAA
jgi:transposase-like protein